MCRRLPSPHSQRTFSLKEPLSCLRSQKKYFETLKRRGGQRRYKKRHTQKPPHLLYKCLLSEETFVWKGERRGRRRGRIIVGGFCVDVCFFWGGERQSLSSGIEEAQISLDLIFWLPLGNECALEFELYAERRALVRVQRRILVQANRETLVREEEETGRKVSSRWIHQPSNDASKTSKRDAKIYAWSHLQMCTSITRTRRVC